MMTEVWMTPNSPAAKRARARMERANIAAGSGAGFEQWCDAVAICKEELNEEEEATNG